MSELQSGQLYTITSVAENQGTASVNGLLPVSYQVVQLGERNDVWEIIKIGPDLYNFAVKDVYPYSGVLDGKEVIATSDQAQSAPWYATYIELQHAWTISPYNDRTVVWTIVPLERSRFKIVLLPPIYVGDGLIDRHQLFKFGLLHAG